MENIKFQEFKPIIPTSDLNRGQIAAYYQDNMLKASNEYMTRLLGEDINSPIVETSTPTATPSVNVRQLLDNIVFPSSQVPKTTQEVVQTLPTSTKTTPKTEVVSTPVVSGKVPKTKKDFIRMYGASAKKAARETGLSEDMMLAQIALESGWGKHTPGYNLGGIKADPKWKGKSQYLSTKEDRKNGLQTERHKFRVYNSPEEGFAGYVQFLQRNSRYRPLFGISDPYRAADAMGKTGYATDRNYSTKLKNTIKDIQRVKSTVS